MTDKYKQVTPLELGMELLVWEGKDHAPLEVMTFLKKKNKSGVFYIPMVQNYVYGHLMHSGDKNGYLTEEAAQSFVFECMRLAEADVKKRMELAKAEKG
jgi:hypothetical protein